MVLRSMGVSKPTAKGRVGGWSKHQWTFLCPLCSTTYCKSLKNVIRVTLVSNSAPQPLAYKPPHDHLEVLWAIKDAVQ